MTFSLDPEPGARLAGHGRGASPADAVGGGSQWKFVTKIRPGGDFTDLRAALPRRPPRSPEMTVGLSPAWVGHPAADGVTRLRGGLKKGSLLGRVQLRLGCRGAGVGEDVAQS